jgi:hypothetical protein
VGPHPRGPKNPRPLGFARTQSEKMMRSNAIFSVAFPDIMDRVEVMEAPRIEMLLWSFPDDCRWYRLDQYAIQVEMINRGQK